MRVEMPTKAIAFTTLPLWKMTTGCRRQTAVVEKLNVKQGGNGLRLAASDFGQDAQNDNNDPAKLRERLARLQADFQNARKRSLREQQQFREYAEFDITEALLYQCWIAFE